MNEWMNELINKLSAFVILIIIFLEVFQKLSAY